MDHGDPFVLRYSTPITSTHTGKQGVKLYTSTDLVHWTYQGIALKANGPGEHWAQTDLWAPEVLYDAASSTCMWLLRGCRHPARAMIRHGAKDSPGVRRRWPLLWDDAPSFHRSGPSTVILIGIATGSCGYFTTFVPRRLAIRTVPQGAAMWSIASPVPISWKEHKTS